MTSQAKAKVMCLVPAFAFQIVWFGIAFSRTTQGHSVDTLLSHDTSG
jgi:hypothetical protein